MQNSKDIGIDNLISPKDLPLVFKVKYLGKETAAGLWGIKFTRRPVDALVENAKTLSPGHALRTCDMEISASGIKIEALHGEPKKWRHQIDSISYGVQDLVYTRVFAMIIVTDEDTAHPFDVHAFVCDSRNDARKLTFALAAAFQDYSRRIKNCEESNKNNSTEIWPTTKKFAIDLRSPDEIRNELAEETEA